MAITINVNLDEILAALKDDLDFTGNADKYIKVNATADGFEFAAVTAPTWGAITGTLSSQTDLQTALDAKANLSGAAFTGDVSVTTSGSGDTLQLTNSGSGTTLNILNSGSGDLFKIDTDKLVVDNGGDVSIGTAAASARFHVLTGSTSKVGAIIQAAAGQTANLQEWKDSGGTLLSFVNYRGEVYSNIRMRVTSGATRTDIIGAYIEMIGTSSYNLFQTGNALSYIGGQGGIMIGGNTMSSSAILGASSTTKGFLPPRMTGAQVEAISSPAEGLIAYATNAGAGDVTAKGTHLYNGVKWGQIPLLDGGKLTLTSATTSSIPLTINAAAGQTANLLQIRDSASNNLLSVGSNGKLSIGATGGLRYLPSATRYTDYTGLNLGGGLYMSFSSTTQDSFISYVGGSAKSNIYMYWRSDGRIGSRAGMILGASDGNEAVAGPTASAQLEIKSTTKGFLPPRMTGAQVEAISSPAEGLIAYATNAGAGDVTAKGLYIYNGTNWVSL